MCRPSALGAHTSCKLVASIAFALLATASSAFGQSTQSAPYRDASTAGRRARARPPRAHDARGEVLAAVHDPRRSRRSRRTTTRTACSGCRSRPKREHRRRRARARRADQRDPAATSSSARGSAFRSFRSRKRCTDSCATARRRFRRRSGSRRRGTRRSCRASRRAIARGDAEPRHSAGAVAGDQHRERRAMGTRRGDVRRRSGAHVAHGAWRSSSAFERRASSRRRSTSSPTSATVGATAIRSTSSARLLEEMYFPPFKAAITRGHARSVMSAYNSVDGSPATQNRALLTDKLQARLGLSRASSSPTRRRPAARRCCITPRRAPRPRRRTRSTRGST